MRCFSRVLDITWQQFQQHNCIVKHSVCTFYFRRHKIIVCTKKIWPYCPHFKGLNLTNAVVDHGTAGWVKYWITRVFHQNACCSIITNFSAEYRSDIGRFCIDTTLPMYFVWYCCRVWIECYWLGYWPAFNWDLLVDIVPNIWMIQYYSDQFNQNIWDVKM